MPESKGRKAAAEKALIQRKSEASAKQRKNKANNAALKQSGAWVAPTFVTVGLLGVLWLVLYYIASPYIPFMAALGAWNMLIGIGLMGASFFIATLWK